MEEMQMQMEDDSPSIEYTLHPITYASWFLGVGVAHPPMTRSKFVAIILRFIHFIMIMLTATYNAIDFFTFCSVFNSNVYKLYCTNKIIGYILSGYNVYHGIRNNDKWSQLMDEMNILVRNIRMEIPVNDRPVKIIQMLAILATFVCGPLLFIIHVLYYYFTRFEDIFASHLLQYYLTHCQSLMNGFFDILVYIQYYFMLKTINKFMGEQDASWIGLNIRELNLGIYNIGIKVNEIYGPNLLFTSANCFTIIVATLFRIYMGIAENNYGFMLTNIILCILYAAQFGLMCWVCTLATKEYSNRDCDRLEFSACGFFKINNSLFFRFVGLIISCVSFLIKFYQPEYLNMASVTSEQNGNIKEKS